MPTADLMRAKALERGTEVAVSSLIFQARWLCITNTRKDAGSGMDAIRVRRTVSALSSGMASRSGLVSQRWWIGTSGYTSGCLSNFTHKQMTGGSCRNADSDSVGLGGVEILCFR